MLIFTDFAEPLCPSPYHPSHPNVDYFAEDHELKARLHPYTVKNLIIRAGIPEKAVRTQISQLWISLLCHLVNRSKLALYAPH